MSKSSTLNVKTEFFKISINNEKIGTPNYEYSVHHVYLFGFKKANITVTLERINGEIEYTDTPYIDLDNDTITFKYGEEPFIKHVFREIVENIEENSSLTGFFEPLYIRVSNENNLYTNINNTHTFNANQIDLSIKGTRSIINILIYPLKLLWIYSPKARIEVSKMSDKLILKIEESLDEQISENLEKNIMKESKNQLTKDLTRERGIVLEHDNRF